MKLREISPNTVKGSWTPDLTLRKLWAVVELEKIKDNFDTVYILGSWYGNTSIILSLLKSRLEFKRIINVDNDQSVLGRGDKIINQLGLDNIESMNADVNELDYRQLGKNGLVINTSAADIAGDKWLENIPQGTVVLIQARNRSGESPNQFQSLDELESKYPLSKILYRGQRKFKDPETVFDSYMIIGQK